MCRRGYSLYPWHITATLFASVISEVPGRIMSLCPTKPSWDPAGTSCHHSRALHQAQGSSNMKELSIFPSPPSQVIEAIHHLGESGPIVIVEAAHAIAHFREAITLPHREDVWKKNKFTILHVIELMALFYRWSNYDCQEQLRSHSASDKDE